MARTRVELNSAAIQKMLDGGNGIREDLQQRAQAVLAQAESIAPVKTGNYRDGLQVVEEHTDRVVFRVGSKAPHAHLVEAQSGVMAKALDAAGGS